MFDDVSRYVNHCKQCAQGKVGNWRKSGGSYPLPLATEVWQDIEIDFVPNLPVSGTERYTRIATIVDRRSKEVIVIPCWDNMTATHFAHLFLDHVWAKRGMPIVIQTDCDPLFISAIWGEFATRMGFDPALAAPFRHQQQGSVERANGLIETMLRMWVSREEHEWARYLQAVAFFLNLTPTQGFGISPFEVVHGFVPRRGFGDVDDVPIATTGAPGSRAAEVKVWVDEKLLDMEVNNSRVDGRGWKPAPGEWVFLSTANLNPDTVGIAKDSRLKPRYVGPYVVLQHAQYTAAVHLELPLKWRVRQLISIDRLRPCRGREPMEILVDEQGLPFVNAEVEQIVAHGCAGRGRRKTVKELVVRFAGFSKEFDRVYSVGGDDDLATLVETAPAVVDAYVRSQLLTLRPDIQKKLDAALSDQ